MLRTMLLPALLAGLVLLACSCAVIGGKTSTERTRLGRELFSAAEAGDLGKVRELLAQGADVNTRGDKGLMPLHCAAYGGHVEIAELLIEKGADVNATSYLGKTPLFFATDKKMIALLKKHGAR